jgi:hypothetical protein
LYPFGLILQVLVHRKSVYFLSSFSREH